MRQCKSTKLLKKLFYFNIQSNLIKAVASALPIVHV